MGRKAVFLEHVQLNTANSMSLLEGSITLDRALSDLKGLSVGREDLLSTLMSLASVEISCHIRGQKGGFYPESSAKAMRGLDVLNDMLTHPRWRQTVLNHLWEELKPKDMTWLRVFSEHLTAQAAYAILMNLPKPTSRGRAKVLVSTKVGGFLPEEKRMAVAEIARAKGKIELLYHYTAWPCCHHNASKKSRDNLMAADLGL